MRRHQRHGSGAGALALLLLLLAGPAAASAGDDLAQARREAAAVARDVDALTARLSAQVAAEQAALSAVSAGVQDAVAAETTADEAAGKAADARARQARTVRALYASGGDLGVYASVLSSASLDDLAGRQQMAQRVLRFAASHARRAGASQAQAARLAAAADAGVQERLTTAADVAEATAAVEQVLKEARTRLAGVSGTASRLEAAEAARQRWEAAERDAARARAAAASQAGGSGSAIGIPEAYAALYQRAAATCPGLRWTMLAAVGQVESRHGENTGPSSAGAVGPMQFMPRTFAAYGVDGDGDGVADPWSPGDAVYSAARYLCASGAGGGTAQADQRALLRYNNAQWYVDLVLGVERDLVARLGAAH